MVAALVNPMTTAIVLSVSSFPTNRMSMVSSTFSSNYGGTDFSKRYAALQFLFPHYNFKNFKIFHERSSNGLSSRRGFRVSCETKTGESKIRRCSPYLERTLVSSNGALTSDDLRAVPDIWRSSAEKYGNRIAVVDPYHDPPTSLTYKQLEQEILDFSEGLRVIGVEPDEKLALFADNSYRWLVTDQGMMAMGAVNVVRGSRSSVEELLQIYIHSESVALAVDNPELFNRILKTLCSKATPRFVILLWGEKSHLAINGMEGIPIFSYKEIIDLGQESHKAFLDTDGKLYKYETISSDDIATLVYTSGTTGNPKGVMLTHKNLLHQINNLWDAVPAQPGDRFLSMLPSWHAYERACEYFIFMHGTEQVYTTVRNLKWDTKKLSTRSTLCKILAFMFIKISLAYMEMKRIYEGTYLTRSRKEPSYFVSMLDWLWARIFAAILLPVHKLAKKLVYSKIHSAIGISKAVGVVVQNGYGMTESSPVTSARRRNNNVLGSVGLPIRHTEFKIVDAETREALPHGSKGIVKVRGPQVMKGYYKNPLATKEAIDEDGWLNTGDIGWIAPYHSRGQSRRCGGVIVLEGGAKDTIVLLTGENVEPLELEETTMRSSLI